MTVSPSLCAFFTALRLVPSIVQLRRLMPTALLKSIVSSLQGLPVMSISSASGWFICM